MIGYYTLVFTQQRLVTTTQISGSAGWGRLDDLYVCFILHWPRSSWQDASRMLSSMAAKYALCEHDVLSALRFNRRQLQQLPCDCPIGTDSPIAGFLKLILSRMPSFLREAGQCSSQGFACSHGELQLRILQLGNVQFVIARTSITP